MTSHHHHIALSARISLTLHYRQDYISYWHRAAVCRFELVVLPLLIHVNGVHSISADHSKHCGLNDHNYSLIFSFTRPFSRPLGTVPRASTIIDIIVSQMFHSFSALTEDPGIRQTFLFLLISLCDPLKWQNPPKFTKILSGLLTEIGWSICISKSQIIIIILLW